MAPRVHGHKISGKASPTYSSYMSMKSRCSNPCMPCYPKYGGNGVEICESWKASFVNFLADMGERPAGTTLDRIDNSKGYFPDNCRWATPKQQGNNRTTNKILTIGGKQLTMQQHCDDAGLYKRTFMERLKMGWDLERALFTPVRKQHNNWR